MIYFLAEYCLDSLNGSFFDSAETIMNSHYAHVTYIPMLCVFIALVGVNTLDLSMVLSQILYLYNLFNTMNSKFEGMVMSRFTGPLQNVQGTVVNLQALGRYIRVFINYVPVIPILICLSLHVSYISPRNKFRSLVSRIFYSVITYFCRTIITHVTGASIAGFILTYICMQLATRQYSVSKFTSLSLVLAFSGVYFFMKTFRKSPMFNKWISHDFIFKSDLKSMPERDVLLSYGEFAVMMGFSMLSQRTIAIVVGALKGKEKTQ